jgi:hypothetical protein
MNRVGKRQKTDSGTVLYKAMSRILGQDEGNEQCCRSTVILHKVRVVISVL